VCRGVFGLVSGESWGGSAFAYCACLTGLLAGVYSLLPGLGGSLLGSDQAGLYL
jgi:hypothetical protein